MLCWSGVFLVVSSSTSLLPSYQWSVWLKHHLQQNRSACCSGFHCWCALCQQYLWWHAVCRQNWVGYCNSMSHVWYFFPTEYCSLPPWTERVIASSLRANCLAQGFSWKYRSRVSFFLGASSSEILIWSASVEHCNLFSPDYYWLVDIVLHNHIWSGFPFLPATICCDKIFKQ